MNRLELGDGDTRFEMALVSSPAPPRPKTLRFTIEAESAGFLGRHAEAKVLTSDFEVFLSGARELAAGSRADIALAALDPEDFMLRLRRTNDIVNAEGFVGRAYTDFRGWPRRHRLDFGLRLTPEELAGALDAFAGWEAPA